MTRWQFRGICWLIVVVGLAGVGWTTYEGFPQHNTWHAAALLGSLLVAIGWMVTSSNSIRSTEREQTLRVLSEYNSNETRDERWHVIVAEAPNDAMLRPPGSATEDRDVPIYGAVYNELNACEYISIGALRHVYDDEMLRYALSPDFLRLYRFAQQYIVYVRREYRDPEVWECFTSLCDKWGSQQAAESRRTSRRFKRALRLAWRLGFVAGRASEP